MDTAAQDRAFLLMSGFRITQMLAAVTRLKIPDLVATEPRSSDELATATGVHAESLHRVLRCLAAIDVFTQTDDGRFGATDLSDWFRDQPGSLRGMALMLPTDSYRAFGELMHTLNTGEPAFPHVYGMSRWEQLAQDPDEAAAFNAAMQFGTEQVRDALAEAYDFTDARSVIDVGGGRGTLIAGLLHANPHLRGTVFDVEAGLAESDAYLTKEGIRDRCDFVSGSFFDSVPAGHDVYVLKNIVHDWNDDKAELILATCRKSMGLAARLVVIEQVVPPRPDDSADSRRMYMGDIQMLVMLGGRERTEQEFSDLLRRAGLRMTRLIPTRSRYHLVEAIPA